MKREFQYLNIIGPAALPDEDAQRVILSLSLNGSQSNLNWSQQYTELAEEMESIYSNAEVCHDMDGMSHCMPLEPGNSFWSIMTYKSKSFLIFGWSFLSLDLVELMATSTDYKELEYVWTEWHKQAGRPIRNQYLEFIALNNKAAEIQGTQIIDKH